MLHNCDKMIPISMSTAFIIPLMLVLNMQLSLVGKVSPSNKKESESQFLSEKLGNNSQTQTKKTNKKRYPAGLVKTPAAVFLFSPILGAMQVLRCIGSVQI